MPHLFVPVIFKSCYVCRYPLPSSAWMAIIAPLTTWNMRYYAVPSFLSKGWKIGSVLNYITPFYFAEMLLTLVISVCCLCMSWGEGGRAYFCGSIFVTEFCGTHISKSRNQYFRRQSTDRHSNSSLHLLLRYLSREEWFLAGGSQ